MHDSCASRLKIVVLEVIFYHVSVKLSVVVKEHRSEDAESHNDVFPDELLHLVGDD